LTQNSEVKNLNFDTIRLSEDYKNPKIEEFKGSFVKQTDYMKAASVSPLKRTQTLQSKF